jgi:hypothetical protein
MNLDESTARRWFGLFFWGIAILLSAWAWTIQHASYFGEVNKLLREAVLAHPVALLNACKWEAWFYWVDTLLFVPCYLGFFVLSARQLQRILDDDLGPKTDPEIPNSVRLIVKAFWPAAITLLIALVAFDLTENASALVQLTSYVPDVIGSPGPYYQPNPMAAKIFSFATTVKQGLTLVLLVWLGTGTLVWITGRALPSTTNVRKVRRSVRDGIIDVLARTRYCLLTVVLYAALMLGIDQAQDVVTGIGGFDDDGFVARFPVLFGVALGMFALHTHSHAVWVWSRLLVRIQGLHAPDKEAIPPITTFAKWWGRFLGAAPWFVVLILCVRTAGVATQLDHLDTAWLLLWVGAIATIWGIFFILWKEHEGRGARRPYYSSDPDETKLLRDKAYIFIGFIKPSPLWIPLVSVAGIVLVRFLYAFDVTPDVCHALASISFGFALWSSLVNRLALNSLRTRFPWILSFLALAALLASLDLTQNHTMLAGDASALISNGNTSLHHMFWLTLMLSIGLCVAYAVWLRTMGKWRLAVRLRVSLAVLGAFVIAVLLLGSRGDASPEARAEKKKQHERASKRDPLPEAVTAWLVRRNQECDDDCPTIPVYLVSAQGGGIRAAYYTARLLSELSTVDELHMTDRVFSLSGVSGGSLGVTSWRLCDQGKGTPACVRPLGQRDLLTPLASAWIYEDALALFLPTGKCQLPGCGFLDRGSWFERALEGSLDAYRDPIPLTPPYLFLNATWVETGERSIASSVEIETRECVELRHRALAKKDVSRESFAGCETNFPTARDQLYEIGASVRASSLAHNSARFPYTNPIGYVKGQGHLADGGYYDNSATQTTADILNEFARQLTCAEDKCSLARDHKVLENLRAKIAITAIVIRNGVRDNSDPSEANCSLPSPVSPQNTAANAAGPLITAINSTGIGTPARVAQCNLMRALSRFEGIQGLKSQKTDGGYVDVRLVSTNTLFPLGWYLSPVAQEGIETEAGKCVHKANGLAAQLQHLANSEDASAGKREVKSRELLSCFQWVREPLPH